MDIYLPDNIKTVLSILESSGFEAYVVGGCVRDSLMGKLPDDFDVTTSALPEEVKKCFSSYRVIETGIKHGTVTVVAENENIEITTYRIDGDYSDNRHPDRVEFSSELYEDLKRRDFSINAMAYSPTRGFADIFGGVNDIKNRVISCVGNPEKRFAEDGLRILRALRFASVLGFDISEETSKSIHKSRNLLRGMSSERIFSEFKKLLCGKNVFKILTEYVDVIGIFIPEILKTVNFEQHNFHHCYDVFIHTAEAVKSSEPDELVRLSVFFHDIGKPFTYSCGDDGVGHFYSHGKVGAQIAFDVLSGLKADSYTRDAVKLLVEKHDICVQSTEKSVKRLVSKMGFEMVRKLMKVKRADVSAQSPEFVASRLKSLDEIERLVDKIEKDGACLSLKSLEINGNDLKSIGFSEGRQIGEVLNRILSAVIDGELHNEKSELLKFAVDNFNLTEK